MIEAAVNWIRRNTLPASGVIVHSRQQIAYPEVTGYFIPTLLNIGERDTAHQYASWLKTIQQSDGSFGAPNGSYGFVFDTGQVIRGWVSILPQMPELEAPLRRACDWLLSTADQKTGRLRVPPSGSAWSLGTRGEVNEGIHLYVLGPLRQAGDLLNEPRYLDFVHKSVAFYLANANVTSFEHPNALSHFFAYMQEALVELGHSDVARKGMASVSRYQLENGAIPGYSDVSWVCSTGLAQLAKVWYSLGETNRADRALGFMAQLQNSSGGFFGSYGVQANYFPSEEISWAVKYAIDATQTQIANHFDVTVSAYNPEIASADGRVDSVLHHAGDLNGKRVLDAGCGKGRYSALMKKLYPGADITAMDISAEMLKHVPEGIRTVQNGILNMPFPDNSFDLVICVEALEHVVQTDAGVRELARVVANGGQLIVIDKNKEKIGVLEMPHWEKWFGREELLGAMRECGLDARAEDIGHDNVTTADGLFVSWIGRKASRNESEPEHVGTVDNFFREKAFDERNKLLLEEARQEQYGNVMNHLFERDRSFLNGQVTVRKEEMFEHRFGMRAIHEFFSKNAATLLDERKNAVCEIGFGAGVLAVKLVGLGFEVTAIDASAPRVFALMSSENPKRNPQFHLGFAEQLPYGKDQFDFVILQSVLDEVVDLSKSFSELARVLKPGGLFFVEVSDGGSQDGPDRLRLFSRELVERFCSTHPLKVGKLHQIPAVDGEDAVSWFCFGKKQLS